MCIRNQCLSVRFQSVILLSDVHQYIISCNNVEQIQKVVGDYIVAALHEFAFFVLHINLNY